MNLYEIRLFDKIKNERSQVKKLDFENNIVSTFDNKSFDLLSDNIVLELPVFFEDRNNVSLYEGDIFSLYRLGEKNPLLSGLTISIPNFFHLEEFWSFEKEQIVKIGETLYTEGGKND